MSDVIISKVLYDDRLVKYYNHFLDTKIVHQPLLKDYIKQLKKEQVNSSVFHIIIHDHKDDDGNTYVNEIIDEINSEETVVHIIDPRSFYHLPKCNKIFYYISMDKKTTKKLKKLGGLIENVKNKEDYMLVVVEDYESITLNLDYDGG